MYSKLYKFSSAVQVLFVLSWVIGCSSLSMRTMSMQSPDTRPSPLEVLTSNYLLSVVGQPKQKQALKNYKRGLYALRNAPGGLWFSEACPPVFQLLKLGYTEAAIAYLNCYNQQKHYLRYRKGVKLPIVCPLHGESLVTLAWRHTEGQPRNEIISKLLMSDLVYNVDTFSEVDVGVKKMIFHAIMTMKLWNSWGELQKDMAVIEQGSTKRLPSVSIVRKKAPQVGLGLYGILSVNRVAAMAQLPFRLCSLKPPERKNALMMIPIPHPRYGGLSLQALMSLKILMASRDLCNKTIDALCIKVKKSVAAAPKSPLSIPNVLLVKHLSSLRESLRYGVLYEKNNPYDLTVKKKLSRVVRTYCFSCKKGLSGKGLCKCCGRSWCRTKKCFRYHKKYSKRLLQRIQKKPLRPCASCGQNRGRFRCTGCNSHTWYCSRLCQKRHWKIHEAVCRETREIKFQRCSWPRCPSHGLSEQDFGRVVASCSYAKCKGRHIVASCKHEKCAKYGWQIVHQHGVKYHKGLDSMTAMTLQGLLCCALSLSIDCIVEKPTENCKWGPDGEQLLAAFDRLKDKLHPLPFTAEAFIAGLSMTYQRRQAELSNLARTTCSPPCDAFDKQS